MTMTKHVAIVLKKSRYTMAFYSADGQLQSLTEGSLPRGLGAEKKAEFLRKLVKAKKDVAIESVTLVPGADEMQEFFVTMAVDPTDDFMQMVRQKVSQLKGSGTPFYKMIYEKAQNRVDYLLSIVLLDPLFFKGIQRSWIKKGDFRWLMIPPDYAQLSELLKHQLPQKSNTLWILFSHDHTLLINMDEKEVKTIKTLSFGRDPLAAALRDAFYSENQIKQLLTLELNFLTYHEIDRAVAFKMKIDHFLEDIRHQIHILRDNMNVAVSQVGLLSGEFRVHQIEPWLEKMLEVPIYQIETCEGLEKIPEDDRFLFQAIRSEMEGRYLPVSEFPQTQKKRGLIFKEESLLGLSMMGVLLVVWLMNWGLSVWVDRVAHAAERSRARLFCAKQAYQETTSLPRKRP